MSGRKKTAVVFEAYIGGRRRMWVGLWSMPRLGEAGIKTSDNRLLGSMGSGLGGERGKTTGKAEESGDGGFWVGQGGKGMGSVRKTVSSAGL